MSSQKTLKIIFQDLAKKVGQLSEADFQKIEKGSHELSLVLTKKKSKQPGSEESSENHMEALYLKLQKCISRDEGHGLISEALNNKKELEQFAKYLDVLVLKQDKVDQIKDKIIEATVGAILRSNAIQGKNITKK